MGLEHRGHHLPPGWTEKACPGCGVVQPRSEYGTQSRCRSCRAREYQINKARIRERRREHYRANREASIRYSVEWKRRNPDKMRDYNLKAKYGIPYGTFDRLMGEQDGRCAICQLEHPKTLHVDHCHDSGVVRGLLCDTCNRGIGYFAEDADRLRAAARYVEGHQRT